MNLMQYGKTTRSGHTMAGNSMKQCDDLVTELVNKWKADQEGFTNYAEITGKLMALLGDAAFLHPEVYRMLQDRNARIRSSK